MSESSQGYRRSTANSTAIRELVSAQESKLRRCLALILPKATIYPLPVALCCRAVKGADALGAGVVEA